MPEIARLSEGSDWIDLHFVESERTPERVMKLGIQMDIAELSLSNTIYLIGFCVQRLYKAVHDWVQKAELQPENNEISNQVVLDESVIRINDQQY